jgi:hypothetical protein
MDASTSTIGAFLIGSGYEIDVEIAYGSNWERSQANARADEAVAFCTLHTPQGRQFFTRLRVKASTTHSIRITLQPDGARYRIVWNVSGAEARTPSTTTIPAVPVWPVVSLENFDVKSGHGNYITTAEKEVRFEHVKYTP